MIGHRHRILLLYAASVGNSTFSYQQAWPRQFSKHPKFVVTGVNLADRGVGARLRSAFLIRRWRGDAIVLLHSVFSNAQLLSGRLLEAIARRPEPRAFFIGNEYKLMPEKMQFCETLSVSLLVSQSSSCDVHSLYRHRLGCAVEGIPNTGLDADMFQPRTDPGGRPIDLGYRADLSPRYLGHTERQDIADYFQSRADTLGLRVDISLDPSQRFDETGWAGFLNRCKGQLGTEAGGDYFELTDRTRVAVNKFELAHPQASFQDVYDLFFRDYCRSVPIRIMSGRNVEAAGTKTAQVLFEGRYDGYFEPDVHYIPLKKDFSNIDDVMRKFRDTAFRSEVADRAYHVATTQLTYPRLIDRFADALERVAPAQATHA
jgi:hypothetical protein